MQEGGRINGFRFLTAFRTEGRLLLALNGPRVAFRSCIINLYPPTKQFPAVCMWSQRRRLRPSGGAGFGGGRGDLSRAVKLAIV